DALLHPTFDRGDGYNVLAEGVAASPGAAVGELVFSAPDAVAAAAEGRSVILARPFTEADDVAGFHAAKGILTSEGGKASHAALVARGMGVPAVTGAHLAIDVACGARRRGPPGGAGRAPAAAGGGLRRHLRCDAGPAGDDPAARPTATRVPAQPSGSECARRTRATRRRRRPRGARGAAGAG